MNDFNLARAQDNERGIIVPPENNLDFQPYDVYRRLSRQERKEMQEKIEKNTVKFAGALDEEILPKMPKKKSSLKAQRHFLGIYAERQARLQAQIEWLHSEQEKHKRENTSISA